MGSSLVVQPFASLKDRFVHIELKVRNVTGIESYFIYHYVLTEFAKIVLGCLSIENWLAKMIS